MSNDKISLIIEIDKEVYEHIRDKKFFISPWVDDAIAQGTLITDGDVEKAVEILRNYHNGYFGYKIDDVKKAHDLAITALVTSSTRPQGELICPNCDLYEQVENDYCQYAGQFTMGCRNCRYFVKKGGAE